jgi:hypothetical protein
VFNPLLANFTLYELVLLPHEFNFFGLEGALFHLRSSSTKQLCLFACISIHSVI